MRFMTYGSACVIDDASLKVTDVGGGWSVNTLGAFDNSGKHYFEVVNTGTQNLGEGVFGCLYYNVGLAVLQNYSLINYWYLDDYRGGCRGNPGGSVSTSSYPYKAGTRCLIAYDMDAGTVAFGVYEPQFNSGQPLWFPGGGFNTLAGFTVCPMVQVTSGASVRFVVNPDDWMFTTEGSLPPTENHPIAKVHAFHEIDRGGELGIGGKVTEFSRPGAYKVRLYDQERGTLLATTTSAENGDYAFEGINEKPKFVIAFDHTEPVQNAAIKDNVVPS